MKGFILVAALLVTGAFAQAAEAHGPQVPSDIAVPAGNKAFLDAHAVGVQIYSCNATATGHAWTFVAPRANLYDHGSSSRPTSPARRGRPRAAARSSAPASTAPRSTRRRSTGCSCPPRRRRRAASATPRSSSGSTRPEASSRPPRTATRARSARSARCRTPRVTNSGRPAVAGLPIVSGSSAGCGPPARSRARCLGWSCPPRPDVPDLLGVRAAVLEHVQAVAQVHDLDQAVLDDRVAPHHDLFVAAVSGSDESRGSSSITVPSGFGVKRDRRDGPRGFAMSTAYIPRECHPRRHARQRVRVPMTGPDMRALVASLTVTRSSQSPTNDPTRLLM